MKYIKIILLVCLGCIPQIKAACSPGALPCVVDCNDACNISVHTTLIPRKISQNSVVELGLHNHYHRYAPERIEDDSWFNAEVTAPYFFKSVHNKKIAHYFIPNCQECISVGQNNTSTISSPWLVLLANPSLFQSQLCIKPSRKVLGGAIKLYFNFDHVFPDCSWLSNWWASVFIPVQQVRHSLHMTETVTGAPGIINGITNVTQALNNPEWQFGKWSPIALKKTGVDDICIKFGNTLQINNGHTDVYGLIFVPTGRGTQSRYLFEPLVGGNHVGLGIGFNGDYLAYSCGSNSVDLMVDMRYAYFLKHKETRSIDLFNGDLTRYFLVVRPTNTIEPLYGINFFTREVEVTPRSMLEFWTAVNFKHCNVHVEVGYDFWYRSKEKIRLPDQDLGVGILDIENRPALSGTCLTSAHCQRICRSLPTPGVQPPLSHDPTFTSVQSSQAVNEQGTTGSGNKCCSTFCATPEQCSFLNLDSAANPRAITNTVYAAISYDTCWCDHPTMIGVGGQYEFSAGRSAISQYGIWLKTAISF